MNYEDMSDFEINAAVLILMDEDSTIESISRRENKLKCLNSTAIVKFKDLDEPARFNGCGNASDAWPIIAGNKISIEFDGEDQCDEPVSWVNARSLLTDDVCMHQSNPLRAAMICFLKMKDSENVN